MNLKNDTRIVGFPLYQGCTLMDFAGATQMFNAYTGAGFKPVWIAQELSTICTTEDVSVMPKYTFDDTPDIDILFVLGGGGKGVSEAMCDEYFVKAIDRLAENAEWSGSVCTGSFIFAATGRFDHCEATTYWSQLKNLALFPHIHVNENAYPSGIFNLEKKVFSGGGISSSIDLSLKLIQEIKGDKACELSELTNQYALNQPLHSGNPHLASPETTASVLETQIKAGFIDQIEAATRQVISKMN